MPTTLTVTVSGGVGAGPGSSEGVVAQAASASAANRGAILRITRADADAMRQTQDESSLRPVLQIALVLDDRPSGQEQARHQWPQHHPRKAQRGNPAQCRDQNDPVWDAGIAANQDRS